MNDVTRLDTIARRLLTAQRATRGLRHLANAAVELGEPVDSAGVAAIQTEFRQAYRDAHEILTSGKIEDVVYLAAQLEEA